MTIGLLRHSVLVLRHSLRHWWVIRHSSANVPPVELTPMMPPLVDTHCHLLAGLDDGPKTPEDALAMCRLTYDQGVRHSVALAHQNEDYPDNSPARKIGRAHV